MNDDVLATPDAGVPNDEPDYDKVLGEVLDTNPQLREDLSTTLSELEEDPTTPKAGGEQAGFWAREWEKFTSDPLGDIYRAGNDMGNAIARGTTKAVANIHRTVVNTGIHLSKATGAYKLGRTPEEETAFLKWYDQPTSQWKPTIEGTEIPLTIREDHVDKWMGPSAGGAAALVEGVAQFGTGLALLAPVAEVVAAVPLVKNVVQVAKGLADKSKAAGLALRAVKDGVVSAFAFDPFEKRLSNMIQEGPEWMRNPVTEFLKADPNDNEALARVKNALENTGLAASVDATVALIKALKARTLGKAGKLPPEAAAKAEQEAMQEAVAAAQQPPRPDEPFVVTEDPAKGFVVQKAGGETASDVSHLVPGAEVVEHVDVVPSDLTGVKAQVASDGNGGFVGKVKYTTADGKNAVAFFPIKNEADAARFGNAAKGLNLDWQDDAMAGFTADPTTNGWLEKILYGGEADPRGGTDVLKGNENATVIGKKNGGPGAPKPEPAKPSGKFSVVRSAHDDVNINTLPPGAPKGTETGAAGPSFKTKGEAEQFAASANFAHKNARIPKVLNTEQLAAFNKAFTHYEMTGDPRSTAELLQKYGFNFRYDQTPQEVQNVIKALGDALPPRATGRTHAEVKAAAEGLLTGLSPEEAVAAMQKTLGSIDNLAEVTTAYRMIVHAQGANVTKLLRMVEANPNNALAMDQLAAALDTLAEMDQALTGIKTSEAMALNVNAIPLGDAAQELAERGVKAATDAPPASGKPKSQPAGHRAPKGRKFTEGKTKDEILKDVRMIATAGDDVDAIKKILAGPQMTPKAAASPTLKKKWWEYVFSYRMNAMLSGLPTHEANANNNMLVAMLRPLEYWWAGGGTGIEVKIGDKLVQSSNYRPANEALRQQGADMLLGLWKNKAEAWAMAKKSFNIGKNILDPGADVAERATGLGAWEDLNWMQKTLNLPARMLMTSDEFSKQMSYRAMSRALILRQAREQGITGTKEIAERLTNYMEAAFDPQGGATNPVARDYARSVTFTDAPLKGSVTESMLKFASDHPWFRLIVPFIKTPARILNFSWERTPGLNRFNKELRIELEAGGERAAVAQAKMEAGAAAWTMAAGLAATGVITGRGPSDPDLRKVWLQTNQPYSIRIPGTENSWVSYKRGDPITTSMAVMADLVAASGELGDAEFEEHVGAWIASVAGNVTNRTYMQGLSDFFDAAGNSANKGKMTEKFIQNTLASFVPNILQRSNPDPYMRETEGIVEELIARVPGLSIKLSPRRNIFGEKVMKAAGIGQRFFNPFTVFTKPKDTMLWDEILLLGKSFSMPATKKDGVDFRNKKLFGGDRNGQDPYDRMLEIMSEPLLGDQTLREAIEELVQSDEYKELPEPRGPGSARWVRANELIQKAQRAAEKQVIEEYPTLEEALKQGREIKKTGFVEGEAGVKDLVKDYDKLLVNPQQRRR